MAERQPPREMDRLPQEAYDAALEAWSNGAGSIDAINRAVRAAAPFIEARVVADVIAALENDWRTGASEVRSAITAIIRERFGG